MPGEANRGQTLREFPFFMLGSGGKMLYTFRVPSPTPCHPESPPRAWAEVNLAHLRHNYHTVLEQDQGEVMAVLKAGAYGHGIEKIASALENPGNHRPPAFFGVASVIEARRLHHAGVNTRIYLLGPTSPSEREEIVAQRWTPCVSSMEEAEHFDNLNIGNAPLPVHLAVDTGMGRGGFLPHEAIASMPGLEALQSLEIEGIGSHLPSADEDEAFTRAQFELYDSTVEAIGTDRFLYRHLSNSAGLLGYHSRTTNLCRPGLMLYGITPLAAHQNKLKPVMTLKSRVSLVRTLPAGQGISYGRETVLEKDTRVATIGIGYGDGYPRALSLRGADVLIKGTRCPLLGRVTMDQIMADVSHLHNCIPGNEVELFGENILVSEISKKSATIPWEILTGITPRVTREYTGA